MSKNDTSVGWGKSPFVYVRIEKRIIVMSLFDVVVNSLDHMLILDLEFVAFVKHGRQHDSGSMTVDHGLDLRPLCS